MIHDPITLLIGILALGSAAYLFWRARKRREPVIYSAVVPRAFIALAYLTFSVCRVEIEDRQMLIRGGLIVLFCVENINHLIAERVERR